MLKLSNGAAGLFKWRILHQDAPPDTAPGGSYFKKLLNYIPADIVAGWTALIGLLTQAVGSVPSWLAWAVFGVLLALTPLYVAYIKTDPPGFTSNKIYQMVTACLAFASWVFAMGGLPFATLPWYKPVYGSILLVLVTLTIPVMERFFVRTPPASGGGAGGATTSGASAKAMSPKSANEGNGK